MIPGDLMYPRNKHDWIVDGIEYLFDDEDDEDDEEYRSRVHPKAVYHEEDQTVSVYFMHAYPTIDEIDFNTCSLLNFEKYEVDIYMLGEVDFSNLNCQYSYDDMLADATAFYYEMWPITPEDMKKIILGYNVTDNRDAYAPDSFVDMKYPRDMDDWEFEWDGPSGEWMEEHDDDDEDEDEYDED
eukprot:scpid100091/ scgid16749/ 